MTADLQDLFDRAGRNPPTPALDADAVLRRARRARSRHITGAVAATVAVVVTLAVGLASQRVLAADPAPAAPVQTTTAPLPTAPPVGSLGRLAYGIDGDVYVADSGGGNPVRIADGVAGAGDECPTYWGEGPLWSPDGRYLAYRGDLAAADSSTTDCAWDRTVIISDPAGHRIASFPGDGWAIVWSPDSTRVAAWIDFYGDHTLGIYGLDGVRQALLTVPPELMSDGDFDPVWSPDGAALLIQDGVVIPVDGSPPHRLPADDPRAGWQASYSPDGADIAYVSGHGLTVAAADGSQARVLVPGDSEDYVGGPPSLVWSPTGDRIAFASLACGDATGDTAQLCLVDVARGTAVPLADMGRADTFGYIRFSPEGDQILFTRSYESLWSVHVDGSDAHQLVAGTGWGDWQTLPGKR